MKTNKGFIKNIVLIFLVLVLAYVYQDKIEQAISIVQNKYLPCDAPIAYSVGTYDERFNLPKSEFIKYLEIAEKKWEDAGGGKDLFVYKEEGGMKVNLVYDTRQEATVKLKDMNVDLDKGKDSYDELQAKYNNTLAEYKKDKNAFEARVATFDLRNKEYNQTVASWNSRGGAPNKVYAELEAERVWLSNEANTLNSIQQSLNTKVDEINAFSRALNDFAKNLNLSVAKFNEISTEQLGEFEEGVYHTDPDGTWIDIYQYENKTKLERVIAHEFGHALGVDHVEDKDAIMYVLNSSTNKNLTKADIAELTKVCNANVADTIKQKIPVSFSNLNLNLDSIKSFLANLTK